MSALIGSLRDERHMCDGSDHLPNCYNPGNGLTACVCGEAWWVGQVGTWHSRAIRAEGTFTPQGRHTLGPITGWDRYFLHAPGCRSHAATPKLTHVCGGSAPMSYADAARAAA